MGVVGIWTEDNWYVKRVNSLYTMVSRRINFNINKRFDSLSYSLVVRYLYLLLLILIDRSSCPDCMRIVGW